MPNRPTQEVGVGGERRFVDEVLQLAAENAGHKGSVYRRAEHVAAAVAHQVDHFPRHGVERAHRLGDDVQPIA